MPKDREYGCVATAGLDPRFTVDVDHTISTNLLLRHDDRGRQGAIHAGTASTPVHEFELE